MCMVHVVVCIVWVRLCGTSAHVCQRVGQSTRAYTCGNGNKCTHAQNVCVHVCTMSVSVCACTCVHICASMHVFQKCMCARGNRELRKREISHGVGRGAETGGSSLSFPCLVFFTSTSNARVEFGGIRPATPYPHAKKKKAQKKDNRGPQPFSEGMLPYATLPIPLPLSLLNF